MRRSSLRDFEVLERIGSGSFGTVSKTRRKKTGKMYVKYQVIGQNNVAVPTHFFKVVVMENESRDLELDAFVLPNQQIPDDTPLDNFRSVLTMWWNTSLNIYL